MGTSEGDIYGDNFQHLAQLGLLNLPVSTWNPTMFPQQMIWPLRPHSTSRPHHHLSAFKWLGPRIPLLLKTTLLL